MMTDLLLGIMAAVIVARIWQTVTYLRDPTPKDTDGGPL